MAQAGPEFALDICGAERAASGKIEADPAQFWRESRGSARMMRWVSLLYTGFFFIEPFFRHELRHWLWFSLAYAIFLTLYFLIPNAQGVTQRILLGLLFILGFVYFPFNSSASGMFVYPVVMLAFMVRSLPVYLLVLTLQTLAIAVETLLLHLPWWASLTGVFFCLVIGLSNLSYSRQQRASYLLARANDEIEHLAQVAERERIARDLHDLLGHTLTVIAIKAELAGRVLQQDPQRAGQEIRDVEETARKALADVREAVTGYRSEGLSTEVNRARKALASAGVQLTTQIEPIHLTGAQANVLCLSLRESVTNIVRHASASACSVTMKGSNRDIELAIEDDGVGLNGPEGNGLRGMRERIQAFGGSLHIQGGPGKTEVRVRLPLAGEPAGKIARREMPPA